MSRLTVIEEVFAAVQRVAPDLTVYVAYCSEPGHNDVPQLSNSAERFCSMCGAEIKGQNTSNSGSEETGAITGAPKI